MATGLKLKGGYSNVLVQYGTIVFHSNLDVDENLSYHRFTVQWNYYVLHNTPFCNFRLNDKGVVLRL